MSKNYLGIDIGSISTKAVIIDEDGKIVASKYIWTEADPVNSTKKIINELKSEAENNINVVSV